MKIILIGESLTKTSIARLLTYDLVCCASGFLFASLSADYEGREGAARIREF